MNSNFVFYGWKIDTTFAFNYIYTQVEDPETWEETEIIKDVFLKYACPAPGLVFQECDFYIVMSKVCSQQTDVVPIDPDDLFEVLRDRELLEDGSRVYRNLCCCNDVQVILLPSIYAVTHFW